MTQLPGFTLTESTTDGKSRWYQFRATWVGTPNGSFIIGYWDIDKRTGEVWNGVICQQIVFPALQDMQADIRKKLRLSVEEYLRIRVDGPLCDGAPQE
jgi:hypothetical protein